MLDEKEVRELIRKAKERRETGYHAFYEGFIAGLEVALEEARLPWE